MNVQIVNKTERAMELLILTKGGRLKTGVTMQEIYAMTYEEKMEHIEYMLNTIKSAFEFVDYTFHITGVSRAFTHQLVRTRQAAYQQESQRTVDASENGFLMASDHPAYRKGAEESFLRYEEMVADDVPIQDARGILPTATFTSIFMKVNLRTLSQMAELRLCKRTQGEYQDVFKEIVKQVLMFHPWAEPLLKVYCVKYGTCAFPNYKECPVQPMCISTELLNIKKEYIQALWEDTDHVANPKVKSKVGTM